MAKAVDTRTYDFVKYVLEGKSATESYMIAYGQESEASAAACASRLLRSDKVRELQRAMRAEVGLTVEDLVHLVEKEVLFAETSLDRVRAADKLFKVHGAYTETIRVRQESEYDLSKFADEELATFLALRKKAAK